MIKYVSNDNEFYTPKYIVDKFGNFDYDPATTKEKAIEFGIEHFDTIETDGLKADWTKYKRIWINPPFTIKHEFLKKAVETYKNVKNEIYILVPIEFLTTKRFHTIMDKINYLLYIPNKRIVFESGLNKKLSHTSFGTVIIKIHTLPFSGIKHIEI